MEHNVDNINNVCSNVSSYSFFFHYVSSTLMYTTLSRKFEIIIQDSIYDILKSSCFGRFRFVIDFQGNVEYFIVVTYNDRNVPPEDMDNRSN